MKKLFKNIFYFLKELAGENHYQRYLKDTQNRHAHCKLMTQKEFYLHLLGHNVIVPGIHLAFISYAHKPEIVDQVINAFKRTFEDLREDGYL